MLYRPDFLNLTISALAFFMLIEPFGIAKSTKHSKLFLKLFVLSIISMFYDALFLFIMTNAWNNDRNPEDGGLLINLRRFSLAISYISFFLRSLIMYTFWRLHIEQEEPD
jgi:uncharacterized membrane protein